MSTVTDIRSRLPHRVLTSSERLQALTLSAMNDERAQTCAKGQEALKAFFQMNAEFLRSIAHDRVP